MPYNAGLATLRKCAKCIRFFIFRKVSSPGSVPNSRNIRNDRQGLQRHKPQPLAIVRTFDRSARFADNCEKGANLAEFAIEKWRKMVNLGDFGKDNQETYSLSPLDFQ